MLKMNPGEKYWIPAEAVIVARKAQESDEDGWTYAVDNAAGPLTRVVIHDETGAFVGYF